MKKIIIVALAAFAALTVSCNKQIDPEQITPEKETISIKKSFKVVMPETKAYLGTNSDTQKKLVKFSDGGLMATKRACECEANFFSHCNPPKIFFIISFPAELAQYFCGSPGALIYLKCFAFSLSRQGIDAVSINTASG